MIGGAVQWVLHRGPGQSSSGDLTRWGNISPVLYTGWNHDPLRGDHAESVWSTRGYSKWMLKCFHLFLVKGLILPFFSWWTICLKARAPSPQRSISHTWQVFHLEIHFDETSMRQAGDVETVKSSCSWRMYSNYWSTPPLQISWCSALYAAKYSGGPA